MYLRKIVAALLFQLYHLRCNGLSEVLWVEKHHHEPLLVILKVDGLELPVVVGTCTEFGSSLFRGSTALMRST